MTDTHHAKKFRGYVADRIGTYKIIEGIGPNGGQWMASTKGDHVVFNDRFAAEEHAELSCDL